MAPCSRLQSHALIIVCLQSPPPSGSCQPCRRNRTKPHVFFVLFCPAVVFKSLTVYDHWGVSSLSVINYSLSNRKQGNDWHAQLCSSCLIHGKSPLLNFHWDKAITVVMHCMDRLVSHSLHAVLVSGIPRRARQYSIVVGYLSLKHHQFLPGCLYSDVWGNDVCVWFVVL